MIRDGKVGDDGESFQSVLAAQQRLQEIDKQLRQLRTPRLQPNNGGAFNLRTSRSFTSVHTTANESENAPSTEPQETHGSSDTEADAVVALPEENNK